jgi:hypothetical protein
MFGSEFIEFGGHQVWTNSTFFQYCLGNTSKLMIVWSKLLQFGGHQMVLTHKLC